MEIRFIVGGRSLDLLQLTRRALTRRRAALLAGGLALIGGALSATAQLQKPEPLEAGAPARAQDINERFEALYDAMVEAQSRLDDMTPVPASMSQADAPTIPLVAQCLAAPESANLCMLATTRKCRALGFRWGIYTAESADGGETRSIACFNSGPPE